MNFKIRKINPDDLHAIIEIDAVHTGTRKPEYWRNRLQPLFDEDEREGGALGFVATDKAQVLGYILAEGRAWEFGSPLCGWIIAIGVQPECSRQGMALALCREVCQSFKKMGILTVRTMVRKDDVNVLSFFRASGFRAGPFIELELEM